MLEVRGVVDARASARRRTGRRRRAARSRGAPRAGAAGSRTTRRMRWRGEQLGEHVRHRPPVLDHVRDPRRRAQVVLEHAEAARRRRGRGRCRRRARARRPAASMPAARDAVEVRRADDEPAGHDAVGAGSRPARRRRRGSARARSTRWRTPASTTAHSSRRDDAGHEVERERPLLARERERDALVVEGPVAGGAALVEVVLRERLHVLVQRLVVERGSPVRVEHLVPRVDRLCTRRGDRPPVPHSAAARITRVSRR